MRTRVVTALALFTILICLFPAPAHAQKYESPDPLTSEVTETPADEGSDAKPKDEKDASDEGAAPVEEAGPPWTYQMARMTVGLVALLALMIGLAYYRFVVRRQRGEA